MSNRAGPRMPMFGDDFGFIDRHAHQTLDDMQRQFSTDLWPPRAGSGGSGGTWPELDRRHMRSPPIWDANFRSQAAPPPPLSDSFHRMCDGFFRLKPRPAAVDRVQRAAEFGSRESLDDDTLSSLIVEDPKTHGRQFEISFDVHEYPAEAISARASGETLVVESRPEAGADAKSFSRSIKLPRDVDIDKLSSTISEDGVLTIRAPLPPRYGAVAGTRRAEPEYDQQPQQYPQQYQQPTQPVDPGRPAAPLSPHSLAQTDLCRQSSGTGAEPAFDVPTYSTTSAGTRKMDLYLQLGVKYGVDDIIVKVDGPRLTVEATHATVINQATSTSTVTREYNLTESIDPDTIQATLTKTGVLKINAVAL